MNTVKNMPFYECGISLYATQDNLQDRLLNTKKKKTRRGKSVYGRLRLSKK